MGPTGTPTHIAANETVILAGGGLGNAVLFSIGQAFRAAGSKVLYFAGYKKVIDRYKVADIEAAADVVIWCCDEEPDSNWPTGSSGRRTAASSAISCRPWTPMPKAGWARPPIRMDDTDRIIAIGSDRMMAALWPRPSRRAQAATSSRTTSPSARSTRRCSA